MNGIHAVNNQYNPSVVCNRHADENAGLGLSDALLLRGEEFLLRHGRAFRITSATMAAKRMKSKCSFHNSLQMAVQDVSLTYVEGYCLADGRSFTHAWVVDPDGVVLEPTLPRKTILLAYFGIAFKTSYLDGNFRRSGVLGPLLFRNRGFYQLDIAKLSKDVISDAFRGGVPRNNILSWPLCQTSDRGHS